MRPTIHGLLCLAALICATPAIAQPPAPAQYVGGYSVPDPKTNCDIFDTSGRALTIDQVTEQQLADVIDCGQKVYPQCNIRDANGWLLPASQMTSQQLTKVFSCWANSEQQTAAQTASIQEVPARRPAPTRKVKRYTGPYQPPSPQLGCKIFDTQGRALADDEFTDKQRYQVADCQQTVQMLKDRANLSAQIQNHLDAISEENHRRTAELERTPAAPGTPGRLPYPLPANTPAIILQTQ